MGQKILYVSPHQDDETLGMGFAMAMFNHQGYETYILQVTDGCKSQARNTLNGSTYCNIHAKYHNPVSEGYKDHIGNSLSTVTEGNFSMIRYNEQLEAVDCMIGDIASKISYMHITDGTASNYIDNIKAAIINFIDNMGGPSNVHLKTVSGTDGNVDHTACETAVRQVMQERNCLSARFYIYPTSWDDIGNGLYDNATGQTITSFGTDTTTEQLVIDRFHNAINAYSMWNPAVGHYEVGRHSVDPHFSIAYNGNKSVYHL